MVRLKSMLLVLALVWAMVLSACRADDKASSVGSAEPAKNAVAAQRPADPNDTIGQVCSLIFRGDFAGAQKRLAADPKASSSTQGKDLAAILERYQEVDRARQAGREKSYAKQISQLESLRTGKPLPKDPNETSAISSPADANKPAAASDANQPKGPVDFNDPNGRGISSVLAVVANAVEYADGQRRQDLLSQPLVQQAMQKAVDKEAKLESEGKWLDAYIGFAAALKVIDPNNPGYKDYAEGLLDKASIASSFEDSPCETTQQRYKGVSRQIFARAIHVVGSRYVNTVDYGQMAIEAIKRCGQLAEVMAAMPPKKGAAAVASSMADPRSSKAQSDQGKPAATSYGEQASSPEKGGAGAAPFVLADPSALKSWSAGLTALTQEVKQSATGLNEKSFRDLFDRVLSLNASTIKLPEGVLIWHFAQAALDSLDPHTVIVWPTEKTDFDKMITNEFTGIGVEIGRPKGALTISGLLMDTPAYRAGLDAGEVIDAVDGVATKDMPLNCAVKKITGPKGTKVNLKIRRPGEDKPRDVTITRDKIIVPTIYGWQRTAEGQWRYMVDPNDKVAYVRISSFSGETATDLEKVLNDLEKQGLRGLVLDLRWNQGGLLPVVLRIVDMFVKDGVMLRIRPGLYGGPAEAARAEAKGTHPDYPMAILINEVSASASEIVAGALADPRYKRAVLVGERTHGKGSVQSIEDKDLDGAEVKYTTAYYYLPSDQRVSSRKEREKLGLKDWGVGPNVEVDLRIDEIQALGEAQRANDVLAQADRPATQDRIKRRSIEQYLAADPQLAVALLVVETKLVQAGARVGRAGRGDWRLVQPVPISDVPFARGDR